MMDLSALHEGTTFAHSHEVARISGILARQLGYSPKEAELIEQVALYHDLGKSYIPKEILNKPGPLTPAEFEIVKTHTEIGYSKLIELVHVLSLAALVARTHHEKCNGTGYAGLSGEDIHPYCKIITVADIYDALRARRSYKVEWPKEKALDYMREGAGTQFDEKVVEALVEATMQC